MRRFSSLIALAIALTGVLTGGIALSGGSAAFAASGMAPVGPPPPPGAQKTSTVGFSCDLSAYGYHTGNPVTIDVSLSYPTTAVEGTSVGVVMTNTSASLPSSVSSQLTNVTSIGVTATVGVQDATTDTFTVKESTIPEVLPSPVTELPSNNTATGLVTFAKAGTAEVETPPSSVVFTPYGTGSVTFPAIPCQPVGAYIADNPVSVTAPPPTATSGPEYACKSSDSSGDTYAYAGHLPMTVTMSGNRSAGATDTVTLASPSTGLGAPYPAGTTRIVYSGNLALTGAQSGAVKLSGTTSDISSTTFAVSGNLKLSEPGTDHLLLPSRLTLDAYNSAGQGFFGLTCTSEASPAPAGLIFTVTRTASSTSSSQASATGSANSGNAGSGGTANGQGLPVGAPDTGGGRGPGGSLPLIGGGLALLLAGGAALVVAEKRRRKGQTS
jgi:hypothetical protein